MQRVFVILGLTLLAWPAGAQPPNAGSGEIGGYGGYTWLSQDNQIGNAPDPKMRPGSGAVGGLRGGWHLWPFLAAEIEADLTGGQFADSHLSSALVGWRGSLRYSLDAGDWRPFVLAGAGSYATLWKEYGTEHDIDIAGHAGLGATYDLGANWGARADARYVLMDGAAARFSHNFSLLFGLWWRPAPSEPAPVAKAPLPEPVVAKPEPPPPPAVVDTDKDGVPDDADQCPKQAGKAADKGCPPADRDEDGIADQLDKCPDQKETFNGKDDDDGCPDGAETVVVTKGAIDIKDKVFFATGTADIKAESHKLLNTVAAALAQHARLTKVAVEGHTDDLGVAADNQALSQKRAEAVVQHLVAQGVAAARLVAAGFGSTQPVCGKIAKLLENEGKNRKAIDACREQNRRVQFRVVEIDGKAVDLPAAATGAGH